ncbi:hypothetical protein BDW02DRAFT_637620 [Decorospora gaudefroyi]|uniref:Uncharacterized protein n=1 Tax=Decorospora gaudefroyi TaxID=184978 RepID=A0A6A5KF79_9PLEO|nr:hypothetical protein BDW02DRAFT_637620 [Decorospora gaudefroyi]
MLPPVDPEVLQRNPNFEVLYADLCTRKLNPDGSTRDTKRQRVNDEIRKALTKALTTHHKTHLLTQTLTTLPSQSPSLPPTLHPTTDLLSAYLHHQIPPADTPLVLPPHLALLDAHPQAIGTSLSTQLTHLATTLQTLTAPHPLPTSATTLVKQATSTLPHQLQTAHTTLIQTFTTTLQTHTHLNKTYIRTQEQTQHGALSRHTRSSADLIHARATLLRIQADIHALVHAPPLQIVRGVGKGLRAEERALTEREGLARRALEVYGGVGARGVRELAGRKRGVEREVERVEGEVRGLEGGLGG